MTPKQKRVFNFIRSTFIEGGISPTYTEIMEALNIKSKSVVAHYLNALEEDGKIKINRVKARGIEIEDDENTKLKTENKKLCKKIDELYENIDMWAAENARFRELLEESRFLLSKTPCENMSQSLTFNDVINRIDQALGEE